jgi:hypothetical protein
MYREMPLIGWVGKAVLNHWTLRQAWKVQRACKGARSRRRGMHAGRRSVGAGRGAARSLETAAEKCGRGPRVCGGALECGWVECGEDGGMVGEMCPGEKEDLRLDVSARSWGNARRLGYTLAVLAGAMGLGLRLADACARPLSTSPLHADAAFASTATATTRRCVRAKSSKAILKARRWLARKRETSALPTQATLGL